MRVAIWIVAAAWTCLVTPALAQESTDLTRLCSRVGDVKVGQWAEYRMSGSQQNGMDRMRLAIIGTQQVAGTNAWWIEMKMSGAKGGMITQVLASGYPYDTDDIHEMVMKSGDQPAMKLPRQALGMMRGRMAPAPAVGAADHCAKAKVVGIESVSVPAGEFEALHIEPVDAKSDVWASGEVPFGMLRVLGKDFELTLLGHGADAKSSISETPMTMPGMGGR